MVPVYSGKNRIRIKLNWRESEVLISSMHSIVSRTPTVEEKKLCRNSKWEGDISSAIRPATS